MSTDIILTNGTIFTFDGSDSRAEAIAIKDDLITAVGTSNAIVSHFADPGTRLVDLEGRLVTPGLIDSHIHVSSAGPYDKFALKLNYPKIKSIREIVGQIKDKVASSSKNEWIKGVGWDEARLEEKRYITCWDPDPVSPDNPVVLTHTSGHFVAVNSAVLKIAGIDRETPQPRGGTIVKDEATGEPTGVLKELAVNLIRIPPWTQKQLEDGIKQLSLELVKFGITTIKDGCSLEGLERGVVKAYSSLAGRGELAVRAYLLWQVKSVKDIEAMSDYLTYQVGDQFKLGGIKIFMDGSLMGRTAWCYDEFLDPRKEDGVDKGNTGYPLIDPVEFYKIVKEATGRGYQVSTHAIGDRAIDTVLDAYEKIGASSITPKDEGFTIIHSILATPEAIKRMKKIGVCVETQSSFMYFLSAAYARACPRKKMSRMFPLRNLFKEGVVVGNGSDYFVAPFAPVYGIYAACTRETFGDNEISSYLGKEESISLHEALQTYTSMAAKCLRMSDKIGSIERGKFADLVVWEDNLYTIPLERVKDARVAMTIASGKVVHDAGFLKAH